MQKHINYLKKIFPKAFEGLLEPENITISFFNIVSYLNNNIDTLDPKDVIYKVKKLDNYFINTVTGKDEIDLFTTYVVSFIEEVVSCKLRFLIPFIITNKKDFTANKEYYLKNVGKENYEKTLDCYN